jgi:hypothetical protein
MTPQERELIDSVFDRLAQVAGAPKDPEAERLIADRLRTLPDATYGLVQAVAVQEMTLRQAQTHIAELERRLAAAPAAASGGGFLGGAANPWAPAPRAASPIPQVAPQPQYAPAQTAAPPQQPAPSPWGQPAAAGGFLRSAATTAVGMAGGMMLAEGISSLFGGHRGGFGGGFGGGSPWGGGGTPEVVENVTNNYYGDAGTGDTGDGATPADYTAPDDGSGFDGGFDDGSGGGDDGGWV